jgi:hypothetical protein
VSAQPDVAYAADGVHGLGLLGTHVQLYDKTRKLPIYISIGHGLDSQTFEIPFESWWLGQLPLPLSASCACVASCSSRVQQEAPAPGTYVQGCQAVQPSGTQPSSTQHPAPATALPQKLRGCPAQGRGGARRLRRLRVQRAARRCDAMAA